MNLRLLRTLYLVTAISAFLFGCSKEKAPARTQQAIGMRDSEPEFALGEDEFASTLPKKEGPPGYVGSSACQKCHEDQHASWHRSYHRTMTQVVSDESVKADFDNVVLTTDTARFTLTKHSGEYWVRMEPLVRPPSEEGAPPALEKRLALVTGSHHMQVFWVPEGDGNLQLGFPFTWLIPEKRWVPRNSTFIRPPDLPHGAEVWNVVCSRCHTTGVEPRVNFAARTANTRVAELGISCEACHGPGQRHVEAQTTSKRKVEAGEIVHPKKLSAERSAQVCGFCHSMKWMDKAHDWRQNGFQYRPGDDLEKTTPIIRPSAVDAIAGLKDYLQKNPDLLRDFFWSDGMSRVSGREYNGLIESPCFKGGKFSCLSCHSLHESEPDDQLAAKGVGNSACTQCHEKFKEPSLLAAHTHHLAHSSGSECYNCHMPHTSYGILKAIRSHQISSPGVSTDLAAGRPNACNLCHLDRTLLWTARTLEAWYQHPPPQTMSDEPNISYIARLALAGDAGQRALAAWHLSWAPALRASTTNWIPQLLAQMLDDPYAAVRCVAERSYNQISDTALEGYDYSVDPRIRGPIRDRLWEALEKGQEIGSGVLLENGQVQRTAYEQLLRERDTRPVRLRE